MNLVTRLWLSGALLPLLVMAAVLFGTDRLFHSALEGSLDRALLAQAAIESVSLFDGPSNEPHLHMATSPLVESVRPFAPEGVLFGPDGWEVMRYPPSTVRVERERLRPMQPGATPVFSTRERRGVRERMLAATVASPRGQPYTLRLTAGLAQIDAAVAAFHHLALLALLVTMLALVLVQTWQGRSLRRRLTSLSEHVAALSAGNLERALPPERTRDELASLRDVLSQATRAIREARDTRERFIADAAHELRTPLTLMRTSLDLALRRERSNDELKVALRDTREEVDRLSALATRLLDMASLSQDGEKPQRNDLSELLHEATIAAQADAEARGITLRLNAPDHLTLVLKHESVRRAVDNLLSNALKHARSEISVSVERTDPEHVALSVHDDGPGIPDAERERVFEPFHRVRGSTGGAGLGLALVREVARMHDGRVFVRSAEQGADVVLELRCSST